MSSIVFLPPKPAASAGAPHAPPSLLRRALLGAAIADGQFVPSPIKSLTLTATAPTPRASIAHAKRVAAAAPADAERPSRAPLSNLPPPDRGPNAPNSPSGFSGAVGGFAYDNTFRTLSILVLLTLLVIPRIRQRVRVPLVIPRRVAFVSLLERPG